MRSVILDLDGTLVDSNDLHARAWVEAAAESGTRVRFEDVRPLIGMGGDRVLPIVTGASEDDPRGERLLQRRGELFRERYLPGLRAFPGAAELVHRLRAEGYRLVVASSARREDLEAMLRQVGLAELLESATSSDDAEASKPAPDIVTAALRRTGVAAAETLMLGDTPYDIEAAGRAGVGVVALRCGGWDDGSLAGALAVYDDPADLLRHYDASPLGRT